MKQVVLYGAYEHPQRKVIEIHNGVNIEDNETVAALLKSYNGVHNTKYTDVSNILPF